MLLSLQCLNASMNLYSSMLKNVGIVLNARQHLTSPWLCKAGFQLRKQINDTYPDRDKRSDGWIGDARHQASVSDHNPDPKANNVVRAVDIDADLSGTPKPDFASSLADQVRICGKTDARISYVIFRSHIASHIQDWVWRPYVGVDNHNSHLHISFTTKGDNDGTPFNIPLIKESK